MQCRVNPNTIVRVYAALSEEGLIYTDSTNGKFVTMDRGYILQKKREFLEEKTKIFAKEMQDAGLNADEVTEILEKLFAEGKEEA